MPILDAMPVRCALTFDDGPGPSTASLLELLTKHAVLATFFILGENVERATWCNGNAGKAESTAKQIVLAGHALGNHTYSHLSALEAARDPTAFCRDLTRGDEVVARLYSDSGLACPPEIPFRLPFGPQRLRRRFASGEPDRTVIDPRLTILHRLGRKHTHWTGAFQDWLPVAAGAGELAARMVAHAEQCARLGARATIVLHDGAPAAEGCRSGFSRDTTFEAVSIFLVHASKHGWLVAPNDASNEAVSPMVPYGDQPQ